MSPTPRAALLLTALALTALVVPPAVVGAAVLLVVALVFADAWSIRESPQARRDAPDRLYRGVASPLVVDVARWASRTVARQPLTPDLDVAPAVGPVPLDATITPLRRGDHVLPAAVIRITGPLGLATWTHPAGGTHHVKVYPNVPAARRVAQAVREGRFSEDASNARGPLGLGTEFESIRDYLPDDDVRQVNWRATARAGKPMSNQFRLDTDRDVICLVDAGRLMASPTGKGTHLDVALDAAITVALTADVMGDRCGALAFDSEVRRMVTPRRAGGRGVIQILYDLEPRPVDSDHELAFRSLGANKRAFVIVFTDLVDRAAARSLVAAVPILARRHSVLVAGARDEELRGLVSTPPRETIDVYAAAVALEVLEERARVADSLTRAGAQVVEADPARLGTVCTAAYLRAKSRSLV